MPATPALQDALLPGSSEANAMSAATQPAGSFMCPSCGDSADAGPARIP